MKELWQGVLHFAIRFGEEFFLQGKGFGFLGQIFTPAKSFKYGELVKGLGGDIGHILPPLHSNEKANEHSVK